MAIARKPGEVLKNRYLIQKISGAAAWAASIWPTNASRRAKMRSKESGIRPFLEEI